MNHSTNSFIPYNTNFAKTNLNRKTLRSMFSASHIYNGTVYSNEFSDSSRSLLLALERFKSHNLADLKDASLMNRVDSKFILPIAELPKLLEQLTHFYSVLEIDNKKIFTYHNQYFDTPNMALYKDHHNGKLNRYKVRRRHYLDTDTKFLEVKFKNNQKRTIKSRIELTHENDETGTRNHFIATKMGAISNQLHVNQHSGYQRIALANEAQAERLTLDFNLWYRLNDSQHKLTLPGFVIAELKQAKKSKRSPFYQLMSANNIFPISFSKYCIGCALLNRTSIKTNRFKSTLARVEKLNNQSLYTHMSN